MPEELKRNEQRLHDAEKSTAVEAPPLPETAKEDERSVAAGREATAEAAETSPSAAPPSAASAPAVAPAKSPQLQRVESLLEEDLKDYYNTMDEAHRKVFRIEGEKTALQIDMLVSTAKATVKRVLYLIQRWLRLIPGINNFFLEQEAKIKTDRIMELVEEGKNNTTAK